MCIGLTFHSNQNSECFTPLQNSQFSMNTVGPYGPSRGERVKKSPYLGTSACSVVMVVRYLGLGACLTSYLKFLLHKINAVCEVLAKKTCLCNDHYSMINRKIFT